MLSLPAQGPSTWKLRFPQARWRRWPGQSCTWQWTGLKVPYGLRDPGRVLPSGSMAWPVMHMAMNWALGSYRDNSTMRGGLGTFIATKVVVRFTYTRPLCIETTIPSGSWPGQSCTWQWTGLKVPYGLRDPGRVLPSGSLKAVAWPVTQMAMNWSLGSYRDSSTMRGGLGL